MAGLGTVDLAAAVSSAGGLGSTGCAAMEPELAAKTIGALRGLTDKPINVNFFCHVQAKTATDREEAWRERLLPYYRELGIDPEIPVPPVNIPSFDDVRCRIVEATKPEVVSFHFGLPDPDAFSSGEGLVAASWRPRRRWLKRSGWRNVAWISSLLKAMRLADIEERSWHKA